MRKTNEVMEEVCPMCGSEDYKHGKCLGCGYTDSEAAADSYMPTENKMKTLSDLAIQSLTEVGTVNDEQDLQASGSGSGTTGQDPRVSGSGYVPSGKAPKKDGYGFSNGEQEASGAGVRGLQGESRMHEVGDVPPEADGLPEAGKKVLAAAYHQIRQHMDDKTRASKMAWVAVRNAGWSKSSGEWKKSESLMTESIVALMISNLKINEETANIQMELGAIHDGKLMATVNGKQYLYVPKSGMSAEFLKEKISKIMPFSAGKALSYLKANSELVKE